MNSTANIVINKHVYYSIDKVFDIEFEDFPVEVVRDEDGYSDIDYDNPELTHSEWVTKFEEQHYTINGLLDELRKLAKEKMQTLEPKSREWIKMRNIIDDCENWNVEEIIIEDE